MVYRKYLQAMLLASLSTIVCTAGIGQERDAGGHDNVVAGRGPARIADIAWLAGHWRGTGDDGETSGTADSIWTDPVEGVMSLTFRWHQGEQKHVHFAFSVIEETPGGVLLRGIHRGRDFETFEDANWTMRLAGASQDSATFVCVENCRAASVEFTRTPEGKLVESWRADVGAEPVFVITYSRTDT